MENFKLKNLSDYHDLYVQRDAVLLADVFENFWKKCLETYELDLTHFLSAPVLAWQACLKKTEIKLEFLIDIDVLQMVEKGNLGEIFHEIYRNAKTNNKYTKIIIKTKNHHI